MSDTYVTSAAKNFSIMLFRIFFFMLLYAIVILMIWYFLFPYKTGKGYDQSVQYEIVPDWPKLPDSFLLGNPTGIGINSENNIVVFHRAGREWPISGKFPEEKIRENTILILDAETGKILNQWGADLFVMPHGLTVDNHNNVWVTDVGLHQVLKFSFDGRLLMKLGVEKSSGEDYVHFNMPTDVAIDTDGSFYVSDGYGNSRVVKFSPEGKYLFQWGNYGNKTGEFDIPHSITMDDQHQVYVADRENSRIQVFNSTGRFIKQYTDRSFDDFCAVSFDPGSKKLFAVDYTLAAGYFHKGSDLFVFDSAGRHSSRFGRSGSYKGNRTWYHDVAVDNKGNIYTSDILGNRLQKFKKLSVGVRHLQKTD